MRTIFFSIVLLAGLVPAPAVSSEEGVYESLGKIPIGRIFLTAEERANLDRMRGKQPIQPTSERPADDVAEPVSDVDPAGFIVNHSGTTRVWKNGDFVATASASEVRFPGHIDVESQPAPADSDDSGEPDESDESSFGAGDEAD